MMSLLWNSPTLVVRFAALTAMTAVLLPAAHAQGTLSLQETEVDLGRVFNGQVIKAAIPLHNTGSAPLTIRKVSVSCGCTTVRRPDGPIRPGGQELLEVEFNSANFHGRTLKHVFMETSDPSNQYVTVTLAAEVVDELAPTSPSTLVWFSDVPVGSTAQQTHVLKNISGNRIGIKGSRVPSEVLAVTYKPSSLAPNDSVTITITVKPVKPGYSMETLYLETDSRNQSQVPVRVAYVGVPKP